jgi:SAM-dependent methyltransferase
MKVRRTDRGGFDRGDNHEAVSTERLRLVVEQLDPQPSDHVLEVGGGHGVAATLVLERLGSGTYTGIDRSAAMVAASERRNRVAVDQGRARFVCGSLLDLEPGVPRCDRLFAARVTAMTRRDELAASARHLVGGGLLLLAFDSPDERRAILEAESALGRLASAGFASARQTDVRLGTGLLACVSAIRV